MVRRGRVVATLGQRISAAFDAPLKDASALHMFDATGKRVRSLGKRGSGPGEFIRAVDLDCDRAGDVYALDGDLFRISVFSVKGVGVTPEREPALTEGKRLPHMMIDPQRIAVDPDSGDIYVYDAKTRVIKKFTKHAVYAGMTGSEFGFRNVQRMKVDHLGYLWAFDYKLQELRRVDFLGNEPKPSLAVSLEDLVGAAIDFGLDASGRIYVLTSRDLVYVYR